MIVAARADVPFLDLAAPYGELADDVEAAVARVLASGWYVLGPEVEAFERAFADHVGTRHCVGVGCGLDALHLALLAMDVGPGDEVLVPASTFVATWLAVTRTGARPVPVEPDERTGNIDPARLGEAVTARTRAIVPVHLHGRPAAMDAINAIAAEHGLRVLEDAAQAHGAAVGGRRAGGLADAGAWSFYPGKNLGAMGDGGAVTTDDDGLAERLRSLRNYGSAARYRHRELGANSRLDELQAAVLSAKLPHLDRWNARRARIAERYAEGLATTAVRVPPPAPPGEHAWHVYAVRSDERDELARHLAGAGVATLIHYPIPPHLQEAYGHLGLREGDLPVAEAIASRTLSLPIGPHMSDDDVDRVIGAVRSFRGSR